jgi:hypothetical protein
MTFCCSVLAKAKCGSQNFAEPSPKAKFSNPSTARNAVSTERSMQPLLHAFFAALSSEKFYGSSRPLFSIFYEKDIQTEQIQLNLNINHFLQPHGTTAKNCV